MSFCCVSGCNNRYTPGTSIRFYRIPGGSRQFQVNRRRLWIEAIQQANGSSSEIGADVRICGAHFVTGEASTDPDRPNFVPTLFTCTKQRQNPSKKVECASGRQKRRQQKPYGKTKTTTTTREDAETENTWALRKDAETENTRTLRKDAETENTRAVRKDAETENTRAVRKDAETENTRAVRKDAETENTRALRKDAETENTRTLRKDAETENTRALRKDAETENTRALRKDAETENTRALRKDAETENTRALRKDAETENTRALRKDAETENTRALRKDAETENTRALRKDAETENTRALRKDAETENTRAVRKDAETENTRALRKDAETENTRAVRKDAETENTRALRKDAETENTRTLRKDAETENTRALRKDAETENTRALRKDAETENTRALRKDAETENTRALRKDAETENTRALRKDAETENTRAPRKDAETENTRAVRKDAETENTRAVRKDAETENTRAPRKDAETENTRAVRKDAETENTRALRKDAETENTRALRKDAETENTRAVRKDAETENTRALRKDAEKENTHTLGEDEETKKSPTQPASESPSDHQSHPLMETGDELLPEIQTLLCTSVSKEEETEDKKIYDKDQGLTKSETKPETIKPENKSSLNITPSQQKPPGGMLKQDKMNPVVLLKPLVLPQGAYQVDLRNEAFTAVSPKERREETDTSQSGLTEPYLNTRDQPSFPCNLCDRTFTTSHYLKRHKLLHVRDVRKCLRCGALFCRRHNHVLFQTRPEPLPESEESSSGSEDELLDNNVSKEKDKTSKITKMVDHTLNTQTDTPPDSPALTSSPLLKTFPLTDIRKPLLVSVKPAAVPSPPSPIFRLPNNQGTLFRFKPLLSDSSPALIQPHLSQQPQLPSSLKIFSAQHLTSALLDVQRNYEYILSKPKKEVKIKDEPEELVQICPDEPPVKQVKLEKIAYDLEIVI